MSYCRFSSDNWRCELYCYEDTSGGWTTHVASNKVVGLIPVEPDIMDPLISAEEWCAGHKKVMDFLETAERKLIGLAHDGERFNDATLEEFRDRLLHLRQVGYKFPDYVLESVDEEIAGLVI